MIFYKLFYFYVKPYIVNIQMFGFTYNVNIQMYANQKNDMLVEFKLQNLKYM